MKIRVVHGAVNLVGETEINKYIAFGLCYIDIFESRGICNMSYNNVSYGQFF